MLFHWLGEWKMIYFEWPQRQVGYALLVLYALLFAVLFGRVIFDYVRSRQEYRGTWFRKALWLTLWLILGVVFANAIQLDWPAPELPQEFTQGRQPLAFLAFIPIVLAAAQFGAGPAMLVGIASGWVSGAYGSGRLLQVFEVGVFGLMASLLLAARCGVRITLSIEASGFDGSRGSSSKTSRAAPATFPIFKASMRADWSMIFPLAVFTR